MQRLGILGGLTALLCAFLTSGSANAAEPRITGIFSVVIGDDAWNYNPIGPQQIIDTGRGAPEWQMRINPISPFPDLDAYYVRFNPRDRSIYQVIGESRKLTPGDCTPLLSSHLARFQAHLPQHPYDFDGVSTFIVGAIYPGESDLVGECFMNENVLRIFVYSAIRHRRHEAENRDIER